MLVTNGVLRWQYDQRHRPGRYLGRNMELDARSLDYVVERAVEISPHEWPPSITTLDQGSVGSCVGNASTYHLSQLYASDLASLHLTSEGQSYGLVPDDAAHNQTFAQQFYHLCTERDGFPGAWQPADTGSSGLAACQVAKLQPLISGYVWATNPVGLASMLQTSGCIVGMPWHEAFFEPDANGFIDSGDWANSEVQGGHEVYFEALEAWDATDMSKSVVRFHNSWTDSWGDHGCGRMHVSTYQQLRGVDTKQFQR